MLSSWTKVCMFGLVAAVAVALPGCSMTLEERAAATAGSMDATKVEVEKVVNNIDATMGALNSLAGNPQANLKPQYEKFVAGLADLETQAELTRIRADEMRAQGAAYFEAWEQDPDAKASPELKGSYDKIAAESAKTRDAFAPFLDSLVDIKRLLGMDLSAAGIHGVQDLVKKANAEAQEVKNRAQAVNNELDKVAVLLVGGQRSSD